MRGRKKIKTEAVMLTELKVESNYSYFCETDERGCLVVVRKKKQSYQKKVKEPVVLDPTPPPTT